MVSRAETPIATDKIVDESSVVDAGRSLLGTLQVASDSPVLSKKRPSAKKRFLGAGAFFSLSIFALVTLLLEPGEQPKALVVLLLVGFSSIALIAESVLSWKVRPNGPSSFDLLALLGGFLVVSAAAVAIMPIGQGQETITAILAVAPALAAAAVFIGRGFSILGHSAARTDTAYLFPPAHLCTPQFGAAPSITLGERISIKVGDVIPVDGRIVTGAVGLDERQFSTVPVFRIRDEQEIVFAGSEVLSGSAEMIALTTQEDAYLSQLQNVLSPMISEAECSLECEDERSSRWSAMAIMFLAVAAAISWNERAEGPAQALLAAGVVALFASVCQVGDLLHGQHRSLVRGWLARGFALSGRSSWKDLAHIRTVECDASRCGDDSLLTVIDLEVLDDRLSREALCDFLASLLGRAENSVFTVAGEYCRRNAGKLSIERVLELREYPHRGISGIVHGVELSVGSEDFLVERGIMVQPSDGTMPAINAEKIILVAIDDDVVARFRIATDQSSIVPDSGYGEWSGGVGVCLSSGATRELGDDTLLITGKESILIGQTAKHTVNLFSVEEEGIRNGTVIALNPNIAPIEMLLADCRNRLKAVERYRLSVGFGGLVIVAAAFAGFASPLIPLFLALAIGISVYVSQRKFS